MSKVALCSSISCCDNKIVMNYTKMRVVEVPRGTSNCPYCRSSLLWVDENYRINRNRKPRSKRNIKEYCLNG